MSQISVVMVLHCCRMLVEPWGQKERLMVCSTLCHGSVMKSSRLKMELVNLVLVSLILLIFMLLPCRLHQNVWCFDLSVVLQLWLQLPVLVWHPSETPSLRLQSLSLFRCAITHKYIKANSAPLYLHSVNWEAVYELQADGTVLMGNGILQTVVNKDGTLASLRLINANR